MKKRKKQNIIILTIVVIIIGGIGGYNYSFDQTKQKGFNFGNELEQIQSDVKDLQTKFYSMKSQWEEGDITKEELLEYYKKHVKEFKNIISRYENLIPPETFVSATDLLKLSSEKQLESDLQYIEWMKTNDESFKIRSDEQYQESLEYEMSGLVEFYTAKSGKLP